MGSARFSDEFKRDAVRQMTERGYPVVRQLPDGSWVPGDTTVRGIPVVNDGEI
jgi:hypothetical protein